MHYKDAKGILSSSNGMNVYRGCSHGCIYCDSRSDCYGFDHEFEDIEIKRNAPELLEKALRSKRAKCMIGTGSMCDPYLPIEKTVRLTRRCTEIINKYGFGCTVLTKSDLVLDDLDLLRRINRSARCVVQMTLTTFDEELCGIIEPNVCTTKRRYKVLKILESEGIPTVVWLCPILPYINDTEENLRGILSYCFDAHVKGIINFGMGVTLRDGDREYFYGALDRHFPGMKQRYIRKFGISYECESENSAELMRIFRSECRARGVLYNAQEVFSYLNRFTDRNTGEQLTLF